ncbi:prepilin-type N-terminal cleavage/methylation domain-containing protein [Marinilabilia sp.]|uniref:prepilin-type N-terminal cleavage/methylation domain-containing protein n=1 Tax=Marinilabilia sp. TaxID=2021252 RepID=UPI0025C612D3|nr:prepilin-type N-terminal cleavage/methylation domain-containing protein [Marinilabilia sp.]
MKQFTRKRVSAFTLPELLVVLVIIGILLLLALPELMPLVSRAHSLEARKGLKMLHTLQRTHFFEYSRYTDDLQKLGFEQQSLVTEGGNSKYIIEVVEVGTNSFVAQATAVVDFNGNGEFNVWTINGEGELEEVIKD